MRLALASTAIATLFAAPAFAQDAPICGGISLVGEWVGGDEASSNAMGPEAFFDISGQVPIAGHMVRMFTVSDAGAVRVDVAAVPSGDPYISLYDEAGNEVSSDDDSLGNFGASLTADVTPGTYCLAARSYESGVTDVSVQIGRIEMFGETSGGGDAGSLLPPPVNPLASGGGCDSDTVATIADGAVSIATLQNGPTVTSTVNQAPAFAFTLTEATALSVTAISDLGDPLIRLLDANGSVLAENDDADGLNSRIDMTNTLQPGDYCIELEDLNGNENAITIGLEAFDPVADRRNRLGAMEFAPTTTDDVAITHLGGLKTAITTDVAASDTATWFTFDLPQGGLLLIEAIGRDVDPEIKLFDRVGREVAYNDDGPDGLDSFLVHRAQGGTYMIGVRILEESTNGNVRVLMERYVPAQ